MLSVGKAMEIAEHIVEQYLEEKYKLGVWVSLISRRIAYLPDFNSITFNWGQVDVVDDIVMTNKYLEQREVNIRVTNELEALVFTLLHEYGHAHHFSVDDPEALRTLYQMETTSFERYESGQYTSWIDKNVARWNYIYLERYAMDFAIKEYKGVIKWLKQLGTRI